MRVRVRVRFTFVFALGLGLASIYTCAQTGENAGLREMKGDEGGWGVAGTVTPAPMPPLTPYRLPCLYP